MTISTFAPTTGSIVPQAGAMPWVLYDEFGVVDPDQTDIVNRWLNGQGLTLRASGTAGAQISDHLRLTGWQAAGGASIGTTIPDGSSIDDLVSMDFSAQRISPGFIVRINGNEVRLPVGAESWASLTTHTSSPFTLATTLGAVQILLGDSAAPTGVHTSAHLRDPTMALEYRATSSVPGSASWTAILLPPTISITWSVVTPPKPTRGAAFDGRIVASNGVTASFSRPHATVNPDGSPVLADTPRFSGIHAVNGVPTESDVLVDGVGFGATALTVNVGADSGGTRRLAWIHRTGIPDARVAEINATTGDMTTLRSFPSEIKGGQRHWQSMSPAGSKYATGANWALAVQPYARVAEGVLSVYATGWFSADGATGWSVQGTVILESSDEGVTWTIKADDTAEARDAGINRGQQWALTGPFTPFARSTSPLEMWSGETDYIFNPNSKNGRAWITRYSRSAVGSPWTATTPIIFGRTSATTGLHCHNAAVTEITLTGGRRVPGIVVNYGDSFGNNVTDLHVFTGGSHTYTPGQPFSATDAEIINAANWTTIPSWYGMPASVDPPFRGTLASQPVSVLQPATVGEMIFGSDNLQPWLETWRMPSPFDPASPAPPTIRVTQPDRVWGDTACRSFHAHSARPDGASMVAARSMHESGVFGGAATTRWHYSDDGFVTSVPIGPALEGIESVGIAWGWVYIGRAGASAAGLVRVPIPSVRKTRSIVIGPGGTNRVASIAVPGIASSLQQGSAGNTLSIITRHTDGLFYDFVTSPGDQNGNAAFALPATPFLTDYILRSVQDGTASGGFAGQIRLTPTGVLHATEGSVRRRIRLWTLNRDTTNGMTPAPQLTDGATTSLLRNQSGGGHPTSLLGSTFSRSHWTSLAGDALQNIEIPTLTKSLFLRVSNTTSANTPKTSFYFAFDNNLEGEGGVGWPMPSYSSAPVALADERLTLTGLAWTDGEGLRVSAQTAPNTWDRFHGVGGLGRRYPLFSIESATDSIEIIADTATPRLIVRTIIAGGAAVETPILSGSLFWPTGALLDIGLFRSGTTLSIIVCIDSRVDHATTINITGVGAILDTLRVGAKGASGEVSDIGVHAVNIVSPGSQAGFAGFAAAMSAPPVIVGVKTTGGIMSPQLLLASGVIR